jgi:peptidoglycan/xylan/chitin deacetylase (PgdA/CDA1 family)
MLEPIKDLIKLVFSALCAPFLLFGRKGPSRVVIYYHSVNKADVKNFRKQMAYLSKECFVVKPSKIKGAHGDEAKVLAAITFDDAFLSVFENAIPVLREYSLPAAVFVPTGDLGGRPNWDMAYDCRSKDERIMSEQQIAQLDREGFEIFSHTVSHTVLTKLNDSELEAELVRSKQKLEQIVGHEVSGMSYPHGAYDDRVYRAAQKAGYKLAFTIDPDMIDSGTDCLKVNRFEVWPHESLICFKLKVSGAYSVVRYLGSLKRIFVRSQGTEDLDICHTK